VGVVVERKRRRMGFGVVVEVEVVGALKKRRGNK
jgi:hypothetical protein